MSFLSIAFLAALPLLAAPILLHLFDRQRNVVIEWGAMQFLMEAATQQKSARRVQHWLLLVLRVAALAALVLALARPMLPASWIGGSGRSERIIVLDNSMSMTRAVDGAPLFDKLIARTLSLLDEAGAGESVRVMVTSPYPMWIGPQSGDAGTAGRNDLRQQLRELHPTLAGGDVLGALMKAVRVESSDAALEARQIVMLTDGQADDWKLQDAAGWNRFRDALADARVPTQLEVLHLGDDLPDANNVAVNRVRSSRAVVGVHQPLTMTAEIQNYSAARSDACQVHWLIDDASQHDGQLPPLDAGASHEAAWRHSFSRTGVFTVTCRLDAADDLAADNAESLVVEVVERVPVLLVEGAAELAEMQQDAYLVQAALGWVEGEDSNGWQAVFQPRVITPQQLESIELEDFRAVVVPNVTQLSAPSVSRLTEFVARGGGLWLALGPRTDVGSFNRLIFNNAEGLSPVGVDVIVDESRSGPSSVTINPFLREHPATVELADSERLDTGDVKVDRRFRFLMPAGFAHVPVLLDLNNGEPLVVEKQVGQGRVIVQAVPLRLQWTDLAVSQAFVVMVHDWLSYLTEPGATRHNLPAGHPISVKVDASADLLATLTLPDGQDVMVAGQRVADGTLLRTSHTVLPGQYWLELESPGQAMAFHVARNPAESALTKLTDAQRQSLAEAAGLDDKPAADQLAGGSGGAKHYSPVWPALLVLLITLIAAELLLSGKIARTRFGVAAIPDSTDAFSANRALELSPALPGTSWSVLSHPESRTRTSGEGVQTKPSRLREGRAGREPSPR